MMEKKENDPITTENCSYEGKQQGGRFGNSGQTQTEKRGVRGLSLKKIRTQRGKDMAGAPKWDQYGKGGGILE